MQGDPLSMLLYAVAMMPLVNSLRCREQYRQSWCADDSACAGPLKSIHSWLDLLIERGPTYGYFPEPTKSVVVVASKYGEIAKSTFQNMGVKVVTGHRFLGGVVGEMEYCVKFAREKVDVWVDCVDKLSQAAVKAPQAAFPFLTKSLQCEWDFLQRVVPDCADAFTPLNKKIKKQFFPAMLGAGVTEAEEALFALPTSLAALGIFDPTKTATLAYQTSRQGTKALVEAVKGTDVFDQHNI